VFFTRDPLAIEIGRMTVALRRVHARAMHVAEQPSRTARHEPRAFRHRAGRQPQCG
jgi:hypothetical protein